MSKVLFKDGKVQFRDGRVLFVNDPADCDCCQGEITYPPPSSCAPCNNPSLTAPGAYLIVITGSTCGLNGSYVAPYFDRQTDYCRYIYFLPSPIPTGAGDNFVSLSVAVKAGFSSPGQTIVQANRDGIGAQFILWRNMGSAFKNCDDYSAFNVPLINNPLTCGEGACAITAL